VSRGSEYDYRYGRHPHHGRERDCDGGYGNPSSSSFLYGVAEGQPTMVVADKRQSLPRSRGGRYPPQSYPSHLADEMDGGGSESFRLGRGANPGARSLKRRKRDEEGYICPHDHKFINV